jgi:hypothetical protein
LYRVHLAKTVLLVTFSLNSTVDKHICLFQPKHFSCHIFLYTYKHN